MRRFGDVNLSKPRLLVGLISTVGVAIAAASPLRAQAPRLFYEQDGEGSPVVLIEEWAHDTSSWFLVLPALRERHRLIRYDLRGQGRSEPAPDGDYSPEAHRRDLERILDGLETEAAHLVGVGMGARIALEEAVTRPERVRSVVLIQPRLDPGDADFAWWERLLSAWERTGGLSFGEYSSVLIQRWVGSRYATLHPWVPPFYDLMLRRQPAAPLGASLRGWLSAGPVEGRVPRGMPVLLVIGEKGPPAGLAVSRAAPGAGRLRLPDSRWPIIDAPRELMGPLQDFLSGADAMEGEAPP